MQLLSLRWADSWVGAGRHFSFKQSEWVIDFGINLVTAVWMTEDSNEMKGMWKSDAMLCVWGLGRCKNFQTGVIVSQILD